MTDGTMDEMTKNSTIRSSHTVNEFDAKHAVCRMRKIGSDLSVFMDFKVGRDAATKTIDEEMEATKSKVWCMATPSKY